MATFIESPRVAFESGPSLPVSSPLSLSRLIMPILCVAAGVSVGTATGLTLALVNAPSAALAASSDSSQATQASIAPATNLALNASPAPIVNQVISASQSANPILALSTAGRPSKPAESGPSTADVAGANVARTAMTPSRVEIALNKTPDALKPATFKFGGKQWHAARMMFMPVANPERHEPAATQLVLPAALNAAQLSLDTPRPASIYTEGDLKVAEYDATAGTVVTSDGRTFVLGTTVVAGSATSWESYRSDLHYRCDQNGSCVLMRAGVVAPNARLI
jgi:hypothetical protein